MGLDDKARVAQVLREISLLLQLKGENAFRCRAYEVAADRILGTTEDLAELVAQGRLEELPGIGPAIAQKVAELVTTGRLEYHERLRSELPPGLIELTRIPAVGPKKAATLWKQLGVFDLASLEAACREGRVRALKGFGQKSEEKILAGLELYRRTVAEGRRLLGEVLPLADQLLERLRAAPGVSRAGLAGSARRFRETVADLDLVAAAAEPEPVFDAFVRHGHVAEVLGRGDSTCSVRLVGDLQVDLRVVPEEDFAAALHHLTGSKAHHLRLRGLALERGLKISEWGVFRGEQKLRVRDEAELYSLLGMQEIPPELREDRGEVEAALEGRLPEDLVSAADVLGNVHSHSTWSDGRNSLEEMALAARALGLKYLTVTEHSRSAGYAGGLEEDRLQRQWEEIDSLNERLEGIRLLKGIESDILEDGRLDYPDRVLERLEVVIGSIHQRHGLDEEAMTRRVLAAFDNPFLQIWGHPTGRLLHKREPAPLRMEQILDKAAERKIAVEVNGSPERLDLEPEHVRRALERGVKLVLSTDAHGVNELRNVRLAVGIARRGWARRGDVVNTLPHSSFVRALRRG